MIDSLSILLALTTLFINFVSTQTVLPTYGGGCGIINGQLYYLCGARKWPGTIFNRVVYSLDLAKGFSSDNPPWDLKNTDQLAPSAVFPNVLVYRDKFMVHGGLYIPREESMKEFDPNKNLWTMNSQGSTGEIVGAFYQSATKDAFTEYYSTWTTDTKGEMILLGGLIDSPTRNNSANLLATRYLPGTSEWVKDDSNPIGYPLTDHASFYQGSTVYSIGGQFYPNNSLVPMNQLYRYKVDTKTFSIQPLSGDIPTPRMGHSLVLIDESTVVMLGGANSTGQGNFSQIQDSFQLNLKNWTWKKLQLDGFNPTYRGCAVKYEDTIIYTLGYATNFTNQTQLIDSKTLKVVRELKPKVQGLSAGAIAGIVIAIIVILGLIAFAIHHFRRKQPTRDVVEFKASTFRVAEPIIEPTWADNSGLNFNSSHQTSIKDPNTGSSNEDMVFGLDSLEQTQMGSNMFDYGDMIDPNRQVSTNNTPVLSKFNGSTEVKEGPRNIY